MPIILTMADVITDVAHASGLEHPALSMEDIYRRNKLGNSTVTIK